jgi:LysM repeat protein
LGCHRKHSPIRISRRLPGIAVPALAGVAAAFCLAPQALADPSAGQGTAHHAVVADTAGRLDPWSTQLLSAIKQTAQQQQQEQQQQEQQQQAGSGQPSWYTVKAGDSLSAIAERSYRDQKAWPVLYWANRSKIHWANVIEPGQVLRIPVKPARIPAPPGLLGPAPAAAAVTAAPETTQATAQTAEVSSGGSFAQCVIARESGGQTQVMNASGHYGLYQFSASTWAAYGGSPADFGHASASEQNQVFDNAIAAGGQSNWSAYDGC